MNQKIIDDKIERKSLWIAYTIYTMLFKYYTKGLKKIKKLDVFEKYEGIIYRLIASQTLRETDKAFEQFKKLQVLSQIKQKKYVTSIWSALNLKDTFSPYLPFSGAKNLKRFWKTHEINELGDRSIFIQKD